MAVKFNWLLVQLREWVILKKNQQHILSVAHLPKLCNIIRFLFPDFNMYLSAYVDPMLINEGVRELQLYQSSFSFDNQVLFVVDDTRDLPFRPSCDWYTYHFKLDFRVGLHGLIQNFLLISSSQDLLIFPIGCT